MRLRRTATLTAATASAALLAFPAQAVPSQNQTVPPGVSISTEKRTDKEVRSYWTPERMREAINNSSDMPELKKSQIPTGKQQSEREQQEKHVNASARSAKPADSQNLQTMATSEISVAQEVPYTTSPQYSLVGRLFYKQPDGSPHACSAAVIVSNNRNTLWTAGHCVHMGDGSGSAGFMNTMTFIPGYRDGSGPYGEWTIKSKIVNDDWMASGDAINSDYAALVLNDHPTHGKLQDKVGAFGYYFGENITDHSDVYDAGYPGEGYNRTDMNGARMMYCSGNTVDASSFNPFDDRMSMDCDMGKGASGGPMVIGNNSGNAQIIGTNSHYMDDDAGNRASDDLFSSEHDTKAGNTIDAANSIS